MRASRTNPNMSAYEAIHGPYNWNRFPLAPLGCKAIIYKSPEARGLWGTRGTDAWYLGPLLDHYRCNQYFVPKTRAYQILGSAELFPQHCQVPYMTAKDQLKAVTEEMITTLTKLTATKQRHVLTEVGAKLADDALRPCGPAFFTSPCHAWMLPDNDHQCAPQEAHTPVLQRVAPETQQRVGPTPHVNPAPSIQRMSKAPPIMKAPNPTTRRALKSTKRVHQRITRNNVPGSVPAITCTQPLHSPQTDTNKHQYADHQGYGICPRKRTTHVSLNHTLNPDTLQAPPNHSNTTSSANKHYIYRPTMCGTTPTPTLHHETYAHSTKHCPKLVASKDYLN
jgi:hypothetical protein